MQENRSEITTIFNAILAKSPHIQAELAQLLNLIESILISKSIPQMPLIEGMSHILKSCQKAKAVMLRTASVDSPFKEKLIECCKQFICAYELMRHSHESSHFQSYEVQMHRNSSYMKESLLEQLKREREKRIRMENDYNDLYSGMGELRKRKDLDIAELHEKFRLIEAAQDYAKDILNSSELSKEFPIVHNVSHEQIGFGVNTSAVSSKSYLNEEFDRLLKQNQELERQNEKLVQQIEALRNAADAQDKNYRLLGEEIKTTMDELSNQKDKQQAEREKLAAERQKIEADKKKLESQKDKIDLQREKVQSDRDKAEQARQRFEQDKNKWQGERNKVQEDKAKLLIQWHKIELSRGQADRDRQDFQKNRDKQIKALAEAEKINEEKWREIAKEINQQAQQQIREREKLEKEKNMFSVRKFQRPPSPASESGHLNNPRADDAVLGDELDDDYKRGLSNYAPRNKHLGQSAAHFKPMVEPYKKTPSMKSLRLGKSRVVNNNPLKQEELWRYIFVQAITIEEHLLKEPDDSQSNQDGQMID